MSVVWSWSSPRTGLLGREFAAGRDWIITSAQTTMGPSLPVGWLAVTLAAVNQSSGEIYVSRSGGG